MHAHMLDHARGSCCGLRVVYREEPDAPVEVFYGTLSEILEEVGEILYVSCPFQDCDFMDTMNSFQLHMTHQHLSQNCPVERVRNSLQLSTYPDPLTQLRFLF